MSSWRSRTPSPTARPQRPEPPEPAQPAETGAEQHAEADAEHQIGERARKLRAVSMEWAEGYAKSVREHAPQATICIDSFTSWQLATKALDEVRREHWNELRAHRRPEFAAKQFKDSRWSLLKNPGGSHRPASSTRSPRAAACGRGRCTARLGGDGDSPARSSPRPHPQCSRRADRPAPQPRFPAAA